VTEPNNLLQTRNVKSEREQIDQKQKQHLEDPHCYHFLDFFLSGLDASSLLSCGFLSYFPPGAEVFFFFCALL